MIMLCANQDQQVAVPAIVEDGRWLGKLGDELRGLLAPVSAQARSRLAAFGYLGALLAEPGERRSCWQLSERAGHATPQRMQALLAGHAWDWKAALKALQRFILGHLADPQAVLVIDETAELKKGEMTVGVARQHAGITGQVENCQTVVNCAYVTARGHALLDFRLYLPGPGAGTAGGASAPRFPLTCSSRRRPSWPGDLVAGHAAAGTPSGWVAGDEVYGRSSKLHLVPMAATTPGPRPLPPLPGPAPGQPRHKP
jgi:SRSO17 transposase